jgi:hypothetical protein
MNLEKLFVYDIETYKNLFSFSIVRADGKFKQTFACSKYTNQIDRIHKCLEYLKQNDCFLVGFNNLGFDYPVLHELLKLDTEAKTGLWIANKVFKIAQKQIDSFKDGFGNTVKYEDQVVKQIDLFKIWHFNNKAKMTSLKMLEFNMKMQNIEDLPFGLEEELTEQQVGKILSYNEHDVEATRLFLHKSESQVDFRFSLVESLGYNILNADDTKIGSEYFQSRLEKNGVKLKSYKGGKLVLNQSPRTKIKISECLFDYYTFERPEFKAVYDWFKSQTITETKGVFSDIEEHNLGAVADFAEMTVKRQKFKTKPTDKDLMDFKKLHPLGWVEEKELQATENLLDSNGNPVLEYPLDEDGVPDLSKKPKKVKVPKKSYYGCYNIAETLNVVVDGFRFDFGTGGIHGSVSNKIIKENAKWGLIDLDVASFYPNLAISNRVYPEHLGETFCDIYKSMYDERKIHKKGSAENAMLKLALNGTYGKSNDKYSVFYDPKFTMTITIGGQLTLCMLVDMFYQHNMRFKMIMANTDGITLCVHRDDYEVMDNVVKQWEDLVKLEMERVDYSAMYIRDVNSYLAQYTNGKVKRKGAYQYEDLGWHMNQSALVIPMAAEAVMLRNEDVREFIKQRFEEGHVHDFMLRTKVPRDSRLVLVKDKEESEQQRICRYYPSKNGGKLIKIMPPLEGSTEDRRLSIEASWCVKTCNDMKDFDGDIDLDYYVQEVEKLLIH